MGGGVSAPPSLGLAVQRRRQESNPASGAKPAAAPLNLASAAMRPTPVVGGGAPVPAVPGASAPSGGSSGGVPPPALLPVPGGSGGAPGGGGASDAGPPAAPSPRAQKGVKIPEPKMSPVSSSDADWDEARGLRLLATGSGTNQVRSLIKEDGEVTDGQGNVLAFIEANGEVRDAAPTERLWAAPRGWCCRERHTGHQWPC